MKRKRKQKLIKPKIKAATDFSVIREFGTTQLARQKLLKNVEPK